MDFLCVAAVGFNVPEKGDRFYVKQSNTHFINHNSHDFIHFIFCKFDPRTNHIKLKFQRTIDKIWVIVKVCWALATDLYGKTRITVNFPLS